MKIGRRQFLSNTVIMLGFSAVFNIANKCSSFNKKPNILFINTDDQAQWAVGAYGNDDQTITSEMLIAALEDKKQQLIEIERDFE